MLTLALAARAAAIAARVAAAARDPSAGVMPVTWSHRAGEHARPVDLAWLHLRDRRVRAVVNDVDARCRAGFRE